MASQAYPNMVEIYSIGNSKNESFYGIDYIAKTVAFSDAKTPEEAWEKARAAGYATNEIQWMTTQLPAKGYEYK